MKKPLKVNFDERWQALAIRGLVDVPGVEALVTDDHASGPTMDAVLHFSGTSRAIVLEFKRRIDAASAQQLVARRFQHEAFPNLVVVADQSTASARETLTEHHIGFVDSQGHAHVEFPGLLLHLQGSNSSATRASIAAPRLTGKAGVIARALLLNPARDWRVSDLAAVAQVSAGLAHRVLARLQDADLVMSTGAGPNRTRRVDRPGALLDLWSEEADGQKRERTGGYVLAKTPSQRTRRASDALARAGIRHAVTGPAAADLLAPIATAIPTTDIWVPFGRLPEEVLDATGAEPADEGVNIRFWQTKGDSPGAFSRRVQEVNVADVFQIYVDLQRDPRRGADQAANLRQEVIGF